MKSDTRFKMEKKSRRKHPFLRFLLSILLILLLVFGITAIMIWRYGKRDEKQSADVAIVLGASLSTDGVSPVFRERLNHGIWLYENGYVDKLLLTGGIGEGSYMSDAYVASQYVMDQGVPASVILLEEQSRITRENLEYAKQIMDENGLYSAIIVSDPLHMKRAMLMARDAGIQEVYSSPTPTSMYKSRASKLPFLIHETSYYLVYMVYRLIQ